MATITDLYDRLHTLNPQAVRQFAVWCARQALVYTTDPRVTACVETTERYLRGDATQAELDAARDAAADAAADAADDDDDDAWAAVYAAYAAAVSDADAISDATWAAVCAADAAAAAQLAKLSELEG